MQGQAASEGGAECRIQRQCHDVEEAGLGPGDALLGAVHEGADGEARRALAIALVKELGEGGRDQGERRKGGW